MYMLKFVTVNINAQKILINRPTSFVDTNGDILNNNIYTYTIFTKQFEIPAYFLDHGP